MQFATLQLFEKTVSRCTKKMFKFPLVFFLFSKRNIIFAQLTIKI